MDDSTITISDDVDLFSSDVELFEWNGQDRSDDDQEHADVSVLVDTDDDQDEEVDVEVVNVLPDVIDGTALNDWHGSPENDEVVVVDENIIDMTEDSDEESESDDDDVEVQEEEIDVEGVDEGSAHQSSVISPMDSPPPQLLSPAHPTVRTHSRSVPTFSRSPQHPSSSPHTVTSPSRVSTSPADPLPGPSAINNPNSSLDDFQTPVIHRQSSVVVAGARPSDSSMEFQPSKRRRIVSPANKCGDQGGGKAGEMESVNGEDDDGNCCSICFEPWDNSGRHRLASLKCGHLYGLGCIEKWLKGQGGKCPSCNEKAKVKDIRVIYGKTIRMVDTTERDRALEELRREREMRRRAELETAQVRLQCQHYSVESERLRAEVARLQDQLTASRGDGVSQSQSTSHSVSSSSQQLHGQFTHHKTVKIYESGQCRVLAYCPSMAVLVISQPSPNNLFPGFGIKKLSCMDLKTSSYLTLHQKAIRGLSFHQKVDDGLLVSVSMDRTIKLTSAITNTVVQTYSATMPVWSCEWNADNQNFFYVGQQNGLVLEFDTRSMGGPVREMNQEGSKSPVVAMQYLSRDAHADFKPGGLIVGQLDRVIFFESKGEEERLHILPLEGNLTSLKVDSATRHMLASFRPSAKHPNVRHQLCMLRSVGLEGNRTVSSCVVDTFLGGRAQSVLGRTHLFSHPAHDSRLLVVAGDEPSESAQIWDAGTSHQLQRLPCQGVPVDFAPYTYNSQFFLAALTDKCLKVHQWK